ncbi:5'-adenylylsulfate reductase-like 5 [Nymphaea thermarum]|nr:5'-adenylylsulfate reductase-like 5 [Nymphaea thermarum]
MVAKMKCFCEQHGGRSPLAFVLVLGFVIFSCLGGSPVSAAADVDVCSARSLVDRVLSKRECPLLSPPMPVEVDGDSLDKALSSMGEGYMSVLFYATWCPFSLKVKAEFDVLSSMFPHIRHLTVEESSALPSVFSRYGVHSLPSLLIANQTFRVRYHGPRDIGSLTLFYTKITGAEAEVYSVGVESGVRSWNGSLREMLMRERYLVMSVLFLCFRAFIYVLPGVHSRLRTLWALHGRNVNFGAIFGSLSTLLEQAAHVLNFKRLWSKLRQSKMRKFHKGANNARVWASSLASVSLGESSSSSGRADKP